MADAMINLPPLPAAFRWRREVWGHALGCVALEPYAQHVFTTRQLQLHVPDTLRAWELVAEAAGSAADQLCRIKQVHGRAIRVVRQEEITPDAQAARPEADAVISNASGAVLAVQVADCVPMLLVDTRRPAAAAVHAGWRGTCAGIGAATVEALSREFGSKPSDLMVAIGPSIGACCYEVGPELLDAFRAAGGTEQQLSRWFIRAAGALRLDLWAANVDQLIAAGVSGDRIHLSELCTQTNAEIFDSYRAAGTSAGRMIAAVRVPLS